MGRIAAPMVGGMITALLTSLLDSIPAIHLIWQGRKLGLEPCDHRPGAEGVGG